jgi:paraquat-inducible protein A
MNEEFIACPTCHQVHQSIDVPAGHSTHCRRCGGKIEQRKNASFHLTAAFTLCALLLYLPANLYPILTMNLYGRTTSNTILSGVIRFWEEGDTFVAIVVFLASILSPLLKILGLLFLVISTHFKWAGGRLWRTRTYRAVEAIGKWGMLDVFAVAILISLIKMQRMASVVPGKGVFAFTLLIVFTLLASASFDPKLIWEERKNE